MTDSNGTSQIEPYEISNNLELSFRAAQWITPSDGAAIALARRLAYALDTAFNVGDLKEVSSLAARFSQILGQLHLTVETRIQGKQEEEDSGLGYVENYLRVVNAETVKPAAKSAKRGTGSS